MQLTEMLKLCYLTHGRPMEMCILREANARNYFTHPEGVYSLPNFWRNWKKSYIFIIMTPL